MFLLIVRDCDVFLDVVVGGVRFCSLRLCEVEDLLSGYKFEHDDLTPKQMLSIPDCFAYFSDDVDNNRFVCKVYKTSFGTDRWIMLMWDDCEGYALYENPESGEYELAWYYCGLEEPLSDAEEEKLRSCYCPCTNSIK